MAVIWQSDAAILFIGGRGTKAGDMYAGGGCTATLWGDLKNPNKTLSDIMGTNGEPLSDPSTWTGSFPCTTSNDGGLTRLTKTGGFSSCIAGLIANVVFTGPLAGYTGRYAVTAASADYIVINLTYPGAGNADIKVGGAFDYIQTASDNSYANSGTTPNDVYILTNKARTFTGVGNQIDVDVGCGSGQYGTWKRIVGIDSDGKELVDGQYLEIDGASYGCHVFYVNNVDNVEVRHIHAKNAGSSYSDFRVNASAAHKGYYFNHCKTSGGQYGVHVFNWNAYMITINGGSYQSTGGQAVRIEQARYCSMKNVELIGNTTQPLVYFYCSGGGYMDGCLVRRTGQYGQTGVILNYPTTCGVIKNTVFYRCGDAIQINDTGAKLVVSNTVVLGETASTSLFVNAISGSVIHCDYNCLWTLEGAPTASNRWGCSTTPQNHNIEADPLFMDAENLDFRLQTISPNYHTGDPTLGAM